PDLVQPLDDLLQRQRYWHVDTGRNGIRERSAEGCGDVRGTERGDDCDHSRYVRELGVGAPVARQEPNRRSEAPSPGVVVVDEHPPTARRAAGGDDMERASQIFALRLFEMALALRE